MRRFLGMKGPMSFIERCRLEELLETGHTPVQAGGLLGRHRDTIRREMDRGQTVSGYRARVGQDTAEEQAKGGARSGDCAVDGERPGPLTRLRECDRQQREGGGRQ